VTRFELTGRFRMIQNMLAAGEIDPDEYRLLRKGAALA